MTGCVTMTFKANQEAGHMIRRPKGVSTQEWPFSGMPHDWQGRGAYLSLSSSSLLLNKKSKTVATTAEIAPLMASPAMMHSVFIAITHPCNLRG
jgi:hypothetical protein